MNRDDDINVPNLGPADPADGGRPQTRPAAAKERQQAPVESSSSGGSFIQSLVIIVLITAVCALGYFGFDMYQSQQARETTFTQAQQQIEQLRELLKQTEQGAAASGESLKGDVTSLESALKQKDKELDSEIAKLWVVAHQKNKPMLESQAKQLAEQDKQLDSQKKQLDALQTALKKQEKQLAALSGLKAQNDALKKEVNAEVAKLSKLVGRIETEARANNELVQEQQDLLSGSQRALSDRVAKLESNDSSGLQRRVQQNEQAVRAFDSTRRQLNQDLLLVKQKLNNLQLMLEQR